MALEIGDVLEGKYRIERVLGRGGMGTVYEGVHTRIHRRVAVKVLKSALAADDEMVKRFEREALAASSVRSPHVVEVFDVGQLPSGERFMILEFLDGESLSERLKRLGTMAPAQIFPIVMQMLNGLEAAHAAGIVHRDLKPANIFIAKTPAGEVVKVLDFGVSKFSAIAGDGFTQTGALVGTPHYMAPEQTKGARHAGHASDVYSAGAIVFRALTGRPPFLAETIHELIAKLISTPAPKIAEVAPAVAASAAAVVDRALLQDPAARYAGAADMRSAIASWLTAASPASLTGVAAPSFDDDAPTIATPSSAALRIAGMNPAVSADGPSTGAAAATPAGGQDTSPSSGTPAPVVSPSWASVPNDPATLLTPSPATLDSGIDDASRRPRLGMILGGAVAFLLVGAVAAVMVMGGETSAPTTASDTPSSPPPEEPDKRDAPDATATGDGLAEGGAAPVAEVTGAASESAAPKTAPPKPATIPKPKAVPVAPRPRPQPATPPPSTGRDFREDI
jgi:eukaryotic-like serine/threonine-protein kinase